MKKKFTFLMTAMAMLFAIMGPRNVAWGQTYTLVSGLSNITEGTYCIAALNSEKYYTVPNSTINGQTFNCTEANYSNGVLTPASGHGEFTLTAVPDVTNAFYIYNTNLNKYLVATGSKKFGYVDSTSDDYGYWTFSVVSSGGFSGQFSVQHSSKTQYMRAYSNSVRCYDGASNNGVYLFIQQVTPSTTPTCTIDPASHDFGEIAVGGNVTFDFTVTTANLTEDLTLTVSEGFSVSPATIESTETETTVTVTCAPTAVGALYGTLTISGGGLTDDVTATLSATGIGSEQYTITYSAANGTAPEAQQVTQGSSVTLPTINDVDCNTWQFAGWSESENSTETPTLMAGDEYTPEEDVTLYAVYKKGTSSSDSFEYVFSEQGFENAQEIFNDEMDATSGIGWSATTGGSNTPKYFDTGTGLRVYNGGSFSVTTNGNTITNVTLTFSGDSYTFSTGDSNPIVWNGSQNTDKTWSVSRTCRLQKINVTYSNVSFSYSTTPSCLEIVATPTITPNGGEFIGSQEITLACTTEGATISYTTDDWENSNNYSTPFTITATTTLKVKATKEGMSESEEASATFTKIQALETIQAIFDASATAGNYYVTFNNWVVSGVKGSNAYVTDGTQGFIVYKSGHGFIAGDVISGTAQLALTRYNGAAEFTNLTATTQGISVTTGGTITPTEVSIADLGGVNTGAVITVNDVEYTGSDIFSDGTNTIKAYNTFMTLPSFTNGDRYNLTGVYIQYNTTKEIAPRSADDIYLIPATKYNIEIIQPVLGGTISADKDKAAADETVTLTATPFEHYHLYEWKVLYSTIEEVTVTNNQFTMPASDVMIFAYFAEDDKYSAAYYYNGTFLHYSAQTYAGPIGTLYDPTTDMTPPEGFSFVGWSTSMASTEPIDETYTISSDIDLYAIFEKESTSRDGSEDSFVKVTEAPEDWSGEYLLVYEGGESNGVPVPAVAWTGVDASRCGAEVSITSNTITGKPEAAATLTIAPMEGGYSIMVNGGDKDGQYIGKSDYNNGLDFDGTAQLNTLAITDGEAVITAEGNETGKCTMRYNYASGDNNLRFRYYKSGQQPVQLYKKQGSEPTANRRYTRVYDDAYPATGSLLSVEGPSIIVSGYILDIPSVDNDNPANLIIEDGAQLIHHNTGVAATLQKSINGYTGTNDHYYLIANPTDNTTVANLTNNNYDLYTFDGAAGLEWINMKSLSVVANDGTGYLYASSKDVTLGFAGEIIPAGSTDIYLNYANKEFGGFNLIGNPFACNAYVNDYNFYTMEDGEFITNEGSATIAPCEGFFVEATPTGQSVTLNTDPEAPASALSLTVSQNRGNVIDRAIVSFDGRSNLHKFMLNPAHTNISLAKGGENFAAVSTEAEGELPVNFKAEKNGTYTITVNTENVEAEYLHLIDNLTGMDTDLLNTSSYTFDAKTSDYASRFKLVFGVKNENTEAELNNFAYISNGELIISNEGRATLQVIDVMGRIISSEEINGECRISTNGLTAGLYILNLNGKTQKIVVR